MSPAKTRSNSIKRPIQSPPSTESDQQPDKQQKVDKPEMSLADNINSILATLTQWTPSIAAIPLIQEDLQEIKNNIQTLGHRQNQLESRLVFVENNQVSSGANLDELRGALLQTKIELNTLQQSALDKDFMIHGLPPNIAKEQAFPILKRFCQKINQEVVESDLKKIYVTQNRNKTKSFLIGSFYSLDIKQSIIRKIKSGKQAIVVEDLIDGLSADNRLRGLQVSFKNQLTAVNRNIYAEAHKYNQGRFKYIWEQDGRILMKKDDNTRILQVFSLAHLKEIFDQETPQHRPDGHSRQSQR